VSLTHVDVPQRSPEWFRARLGRLTGSVAADMLTTIKKGESAARRDLRTKLALERITGLPEEPGFVSEPMQWGIDHEDEALCRYEMKTGHWVNKAGFLSDDSVMAGTSLDGYVGDLGDLEGIIEVKCPTSKNHLEMLESGGPGRHLPQVLHALWLTGAPWCDLVSYDPRFPLPLQLVIYRHYATDAERADYGTAATMFLAEVDALVTRIQELHV
jgi:hypothetical protein